MDTASQRLAEAGGKGVDCAARLTAKPVVVVVVEVVRTRIMFFIFPEYS